MTTNSGILAWRTSWTEEPGGLLSTVLWRVGQDWGKLAHTHTNLWSEFFVFICLQNANQYCQTTHKTIWSFVCTKLVRCLCVLLSLSAASDSLHYNPQGSSVHGNFQARILEWVTISFSRASSQPRDRTPCLLCLLLSGDFFTCWAIPSGKPMMALLYIIIFILL